jgi:hypothetical protein
MAITFQKQPLKFFNVNEPAIFEFTSDADLGVNPNDLVADLEMQSLYTSRRYTIKNILPKYGTGVFRIDVSGYLKSLLLDNFEFAFNSSNKQFAIEQFTIGVSVHSENGADIFADEYVFDSGYIFDTTFVFAELTPSDNETDPTGFYPTMGVSQISEVTKPQKDVTKLNILAPKYIEFAEDFENTLSIFVGELVSAPGSVVSVAGITSAITPITGVATVDITDAQIAKMVLPTLITTTLNNPDIPVYGMRYKADDCEDTLQFRYFTSYGGYCYFYTQKEALTGSRSKTEFINNDFYNQQDGKSSKVQRDSSFSETMSLTGIKAIELKETFLELLRSPKIEVLLPSGFRECEISGSLNLRKFDFEYTLNVNVTNNNSISL